MNETSHPARRLRHGDRPTEPLVFDDAAANKAAEEGGVAALQFDVETRDELTDAQNQRLDNLRTLNELLICFSSWEPQVCVVGNVRAGDSVNAIRAAIEADRAYRQVANKAEVDLSSLPIAWYVKEVHPGWPEFNRIDEFSGGLTDGDKLVRLADVEALLATPPATTGASTVLTDERIENLWHEACLNHVDLDDSAIPEFARAIERETLIGMLMANDSKIDPVAAQAGQVAVPEQKALVRQIHKAVLNLKPNPALTKKEQHEVLGAIHCCAGIVSRFAPSPAKESK